MKINKRRNRIFSRVGRGIFSHRYIRRNILAVTMTVAMAAGIGAVVKYGEALDHSADYKNNQSVEMAEVTTEVTTEVNAAETAQESSAKKAAQKNTMVAKAEKEEPSAFDGKFIAKIDDTLNIRSEASIDSDIVGKLMDGNVGDILEDAGEWVKISSGDVTGYVNADYILTGAEAEAYAEGYKKMLGTVTDDTVRVRADKSTDADVLGLVAKDTVLTVTEQDTDWVQVAYDTDTTGYIAADYISVQESYEYAMSIDEYTEMVNAENAASYEVASADDDAEIMSAEDTSEPTEEATTEAPATEEPTTEAPTTEAPTTEVPTEESNGGDNSVDTSQYSDAYLLACLVSMEAGYEPYEGQLAVANVVLNRVKSGNWGSSISSVIYAPNQFPSATGSVMQGYLENGPLDTAQQAANDALAGNNNIGSFMSFLNVNYINTDSLSDYTIIGNHCFY